MNKVLPTPKPVLEAMVRSIGHDIYKTFTARYTKDIALEVGDFPRRLIILIGYQPHEYAYTYQEIAAYRSRHFY